MNSKNSRKSLFTDSNPLKFQTVRSFHFVSNLETKCFVLKAYNSRELEEFYKISRNSLRGYIYYY